MSRRFSKAASGKRTEAAQDTHGSDFSAQRPSEFCAGVGAESQPLRQQGHRKAERTDSMKVGKDPGTVHHRLLAS